MPDPAPTAHAASPSTAVANGNGTAHNPPSETAAFFDALLSFVPEEMHGLLWTLQDKRSTWIPMTSGPQAAADHALRLAAADRDVYVAVSLAARPGSHDTRIKSENAAGIFGLWADIDIADPDVHKKWNLPPSEDAAMELLEACGAAPSLVVHSGHGLQAWWLFPEFWTFDDDDDRLGAAGLAQRWNQTLQQHANERSWVIDSTFDLTHVMRVPGTMNRKGTYASPPSPVMPVRLLSADGPRYNPEDIEPYCREIQQQGAIRPTKDYVLDDFKLDPSKEPPFDKFRALIDNDPTGMFEPTWKMKRKDFTDQSASSYDLSLATQAARHLWTDEEIARLIYKFRETHGLDTSKALRIDYIRNTIRRWEAVARQVAADEMDEVATEIDEALASGDDEMKKEGRRKARENVGTQTGIQINQAIRYLSDPPAYAVEVPGPVLVQLGGPDGVLRWDKFRASMYASLNVLIPRMKTAEWDDIVGMLGKAWVDYDIGAEATEVGEVGAWLTQYLAQRPPVDALEEAATSEYPYLDGEGRIVLFGPAFRRWLYLTYQERVTNKELGRRLRAFGCRPDKVNVQDADGKRSTRGIWQLPSSWTSTGGES